MAGIGNDNDEFRVTPEPGEPDAHGQAAMLLVESLIHGLIAKSVISVADALDVVEVATDVKTEIAAELGDPSAATSRSMQLLEGIGQSLRRDDMRPPA